MPDDVASIPDEALAFVAGQVDAAPHELLAYGARAQTRSDQLQLVLTHLGWRRADDTDRARLADWLVERAVELDAPATLIVLVAEHLRARQVLRPPVDALARTIATARASAHRHVELPIERVRSEVGLERLHAAAAIAPGALPPIDEQQLDQLRGSYSHLRPAMHAVLDAVALRGATSADDELLATLKRVRAARGRFVEEPVERLPKTWRAWVLDDDGRVQRTRYELGLWFVARDALRAGRLHRPVGRRYADPAGFLMSAERWHADRDELAVTFDRALDPERRLGQLEADQQRALRSLQAAVDAGDGVRLLAGRLELSPPDALDESPAAARLRGELDRLTPRIDIPDLLAEVEQWTGFTGQLTHAAGATPRMADLQQHLHAALLACGLNSGRHGWRSAAR